MRHYLRENSSQHFDARMPDDTRRGRRRPGLAARAELAGVVHTPTTRSWSSGSVASHRFRLARRQVALHAQQIGEWIRPRRVSVTGDRPCSTAHPHSGTMLRESLGTAKHGHDSGEYGNRTKHGSCDLERPPAHVVTRDAQRLT